jgi:hypothetical protein
MMFPVGNGDGEPVEVNVMPDKLDGVTESEMQLLPTKMLLLALTTSIWAVTGFAIKLLLTMFASG